MSLKKESKYHLVVVGSGVNAMVAATLAAESGLRVYLCEAQKTLGGGVRTKELNLPGFWHDTCSAIHPFGRSSPVLQYLNLEETGLTWMDSTVAAAHPLLQEEAVLLYRDISATASELDRGERPYRTLMNFLSEAWQDLDHHLLGPQLLIPHPKKWWPLTKFGLPALLPATWSHKIFGKRGAALWAGLAGHSLLPLEAWGSSAIACVLGLMAHRVGWPFPRGGAQQIAVSLEKKMLKAGVTVETGRLVSELAALPSSEAILFDLTTPQLLGLLGPLLPNHLRKQLDNYVLGPGILKIDYALSEAVPWKDPRVKLAPTVHLGGELTAIARSERAVWNNSISEHPYMLATQPSLFDPTRAPAGQHTFWVYMHTPNGYQQDQTELIETQLERYAPGFEDTILARTVTDNQEIQAYNPNYVGGDILGGANSLRQVIARPFLSLDPYFLGGRFFCCSASVPPGGGIHGMGGYHALRSVFRRHFPDLSLPKL